MPTSDRLDQIKAKHAETTETVKNLRAEYKRVTADNARLREQNVALRIDLARATRTSGGRLNGTALSDMQIAAAHLGELHDRLVGESRRTASPAAVTALRLAAREVSKVNIRLSQRGHAYPDGAGSDYGPTTRAAHVLTQEDHHADQ